MSNRDFRASVDEAMQRLRERVEKGRASDRQAEVYRQAVEAYRRDPGAFYDHPGGLLGKVLYHHCL